jgi:hypothetical protein
MAKSLLSNEEEMASLTEGYGQQFQTLTPDEDASQEEEEALAIGLSHIMENLYSDEGLPKFANVLHQDQRELWQAIPDLLEPALHAAKDEIEEVTDEPAPGSVFFAEGGLLQEGVSRMFELAQQLGLPGADDPDQYSAALANTYKKAGEYIMAEGNEDTIQEVLSLGGDLVAESEVGVADQDEAQKVLSKRLKKRGVTEATDAAFADAAMEQEQAQMQQMQAQAPGLLGGAQ